MLHCTTRGLRPCASNSCRQKVRAKNPRWSSRRSGSRTKAPFNFEAVKIKPSSFAVSAALRNLGFSHGLRNLIVPSQRCVQPASAEQILDVVNSFVTDAFEVFDAQADLLVGIEEFFCAPADVPFGLEFRQHSLYAAEIHSIAALVGACIAGKINFAVGHNLFHDSRDIANLIILFALAHVEGLVVHALARSMQRREESPGDIFDVDEGTPGRAIALEVNASRRDGPGNQIVNHQIEAKTRGNTVSR